jgi:hypothetical protein
MMQKAVLVMVRQIVQRWELPYVCRPRSLHTKRIVLGGNVEGKKGIKKQRRSKRKEMNNRWLFVAISGV